MINAPINRKLYFVGVCFSLIFLLSNISSAENLSSAVTEVKRYCEADFNGARIQGGDYNEIRKLMAWDRDQDEPGWDCFMIISDYKVLNAKVNRNTAKVTVRYNIAASFCSDYSFEKKEHSDKVDFNLVRANNSWKIRKYVVYPRISKNVALSYLRQLLKSSRENKEETNKIESLIDKVGRSKIKTNKGDRLL